MQSAKEIIIPIIPGDGVGPELADAAKLCLDAVGKATGSRIVFQEYLAGYAALSKTGNALPEETLAAMKSKPAVLLGAISTKDCPAPSPMGQMRKFLGLYADIRHCFSRPGSPRAGIDLVIVRECSEGFLPDRNMYLGRGEFMPTSDVALSVRVITREKCQQISEMAYEYAGKHGRKKVTAAHKHLVFPMGCGMFRENVLQTSEKYVDIQTTEEAVDGLAGHLVQNPEQYDIVLTTNLFGDILSEIVMAQVGNLVPIMNAGRDTAIFYPSHGALKQHAGQNKVNPFGMLYSVSMMLHWSGYHQEGAVLDQALAVADNPILGSSVLLPEGITTRDVVKDVIIAMEK